MHSEPGSLTSTTTVHAHCMRDHQRLDALLEHLLVAFEANDREEIQGVWSEFESNLLTHLEAEEKFLIPALLSVRERDARALIAEHKHIRARLFELGAGIELHIVRNATARAF